MASIDHLNQFEKQLTAILDEYEALKKKSKYDDISDLGLSDAHRLISLSRTAIERISGLESAYIKQFHIVINKERANDYERLKMIIGIVQSLLTDLKSGYISTLTELIHGEIFADFLEMSEYLLGEGYKDAAAVICGGVLENHLRQLCSKNSIDIEISGNNGVKPKKADLMNSELASKSVYSKLYQKSITAWLDLRNNAAHAHYEEFSREQVTLMVFGVRDFLLHYPA